MRLFTRRGYDWTERYPAIANAAAKLKARSFTLDGEAVVCGTDGVAVFDALHRRGRVNDAILQAFDLLELDGSITGRSRSARARIGWRGCWPALPAGRGRRRGVPARLQDGPRRHRLKTTDRAVPVRSVPRLDQGQEPGQPGDGETSGGAMVALPDSGDTAAWACGRGAWTLPSMPSGRLPMPPRAPRRRPSSSAGTSSLPRAATCCGRRRSGPR